MQYLSRFTILFVCFCFSNNLVDIFDKSININAVSACALTDGFEMCSHAADAAEAIFSKNFHNFRMALNGLNNAGIFGNHSDILLWIKILCWFCGQLLH